MKKPPLNWRKRYKVWVQARPRHEGPLYAALCKDCEGPWLCNETTNREAWQYCREHETNTHKKA